MKFRGLMYCVLDDRGDTRGGSFILPDEWLTILPAVQDIHITTLRPGHVRGNHYHAHRRELIIVVHADRWSLHWDSGANTRVVSQGFEGSGAVSIAVLPNMSHAIRNDGSLDLQLMALSDVAYTSTNPDTHSRAVVT